MTNAHRNQTFRTTVEEVARQLASVLHEPAASFIRTPLLYPSGATAVVRVEAAGERYIVTDMGQGHQEAELMGGGAFFLRHAPAVAQAAGVGFDRHAFFVLEVDRSQLAGAVATIANCSSEAVQFVAFKMAERRHVEETDRLYDRLVRVFTAPRVARNVQVLGASNTPWQISTLVERGQGRTIFEPVKHHHTAIVTVAAKFHDIALLEAAPARVAMVRNKAEFGTYLAVVAQAAKVVEETVPDRTLERLAAAA